MSDDGFEEALEEARLLIDPPLRPERAWPALAAAAFFAVCAMGFAVAAITAPPVQLAHISPAQGPM